MIWSTAPQEAMPGKFWRRFCNQCRVCGRPVARFKGLWEKNTFLGLQDICLYCCIRLKQTFLGSTKFWGKRPTPCLRAWCTQV